MRLGVLHALLIVSYELFTPARHFLSTVLAASHKYFMPLISELIHPLPCMPNPLKVGTLPKGDVESIKATSSAQTQLSLQKTSLLEFVDLHFEQLVHCLFVAKRVRNSDIDHALQADEVRFRTYSPR